MPPTFITHVEARPRRTDHDVICRKVRAENLAAHRHHLSAGTGGEGTNAFAVAEALTGVSATGTYKGKVLTVTVDGLPEGGSYNGRLYFMDEESGLLTPGDYFPVTAGQPTEFEAPLDIADYSEFHVHVGTSSVNLYKATLPA